MRTNCLFYWIEPYPVDIAIQRFSSLHCKRFCAVSEQRTRNKSHSLRTADGFPVVASLPRRERSDDRKCVCCSQAARAKDHTKNGASKREGRGGEEKKETLADKLPTWPVMPECAHRHLMLSLAVIPCIDQRRHSIEGK